MSGSLPLSPASSCLKMVARYLLLSVSDNTAGKEGGDPDTEAAGEEKIGTGVARNVTGRGRGQVNSRP